jgi:signal transduction histidine kinase
MTDPEPSSRRYWPTCLLGTVLIGVVAVCDRWTGPDLSLALCYLVPTTFVAWRAGSVAGIAIGIVSTVFWGVNELDWDNAHLHPAAPYTNAILQFSVTMFAAGATGAVAERNKRLRSEIVVRRTTEARLAALNESLETRVAERSAAAENRAAELTESGKALRRQTATLLSILTSMRDGVVVTDATGFIRLFNPAAALLLDFPAETSASVDWQDRPLLRLDKILERFDVDTRSMNDAILDAGFAGSLEFRINSGEPPATRWLGVTGCPMIDEPASPDGIIYVISDITSRRQVDLLLADATERERRRIGQDLHDGLGQHLVGTSIAASMLQQRLSVKGLPEAADAAVVASLLQSALTESRNLARGLFPVKLEEEGLAAALAELVAHAARSTGFPCTFDSDDFGAEPGHSLGSHLFRIAQEALNNAIKHGEPSHVALTLRCDENFLILQILNDGRPFLDESDRKGGMGLDIMRYRARIVGAELTIEPTHPGGTSVICKVPLDDIRADEYAECISE